MGSAGKDDEAVGLQFCVRSRNALQQLTSLLFEHAGVANTPIRQKEALALLHIYPL